MTTAYVSQASDRRDAGSFKRSGGDDLQAAAGLVGEQNRFGHFAHALARVHAEPLDAAEGFGFLQALAVHEHAFGTLDQLARLERFLRLGQVLLNLADLAP